MEELKNYSPGQYDATVRKQQRQQDKNIATFYSHGFNLLLTRDVLDAIDLHLIPFKSNGKIGFINKIGEIVIQPEYDEIIGNFRSEKSIVSVRKDKEWTVISIRGEEMIESVKHIIIPGYDCPLTTIQNQSESKVINVLTQKTIVNGGYDYIGGFRYGFARVRIGDNNSGKWGIIDDNGKLVLPTEYVAIYSFYNYPKPTTVLKIAEDTKGQTILLDSLKQ